MGLYDAFSVPYILAWDVEMHGVWLVGMWATRIFWTLDLPLNFVTGYWTRFETIETRLLRIWAHYLRGWFVPDLIIVACDWLPLGTSARVLRSIRIMRAARLIR